MGIVYTETAERVVLAHERTVFLRIKVFVRFPLLFVVQACDRLLTGVARGIEQRLPPTKRRGDLS